MNRVFETVARALPGAAVALICMSCSDDAVGFTPEDTITRVTLEMTPVAGGAPIVARFDDPDGAGGAPPVVDDLELTPGEYVLRVSFVNALASPGAEDVTAEVMRESTEYQVFLTGTAVDGPAEDNPDAPLTHTYLDHDSNGLPLGLENAISAVPGEGELVVTLRHLEPLDGDVTKVAGLADVVRDAGIRQIPGSSDLAIPFAVVVAASD
jgi:hypothetical protein